MSCATVTSTAFKSSPFLMHPLLVDTQIPSCKEVINEIKCSKLMCDHIKGFIVSVYFIQIYIVLYFSMVGKYRYVSFSNTETTG